MPRKIALAHLPTPLWRNDGLDDIVGAETWVKRDDATLGAEAGNKIRKLEYLLAGAIDEGASTVITCGAVQSNHARATALLARGLGMRTELFLRTADERATEPFTGNHFLDRLVGAEVHFITPSEYRDRMALMTQRAEQIAHTGERAYVIPEGGSNGLGALGYVDAMREIEHQVGLGLAGARTPFDAVVHACGSGGTSAGIAMGAGAFGVTSRVVAVAVCDDKRYFEKTIARIAGEARALDPSLGAPHGLELRDEFKGPAYGEASPAQKRFIVDVARRTGLVLDPVYSGKALFALANLVPKPKRALFIHTGGLPGLLADGGQLGPLSGTDPGD